MVPKREPRCGCSSSGRAPPCQGGGSEFEPRHPLHFPITGHKARTISCNSPADCCSRRLDGAKPLSLRSKDADEPRHPLQKDKERIAFLISYGTVAKW